MESGDVQSHNFDRPFFYQLLHHAGPRGQFHHVQPFLGNLAGKF